MRKVSIWKIFHASTFQRNLFQQTETPIRDKVIIVTQRSTIHYYVNLLFVEDFIRHARFHRDR